MSRYIDADKLALHLSDFALQESPNWGANDHGSADAYEAINECIKAIEQQPTADVRENVRGEWIDKGKNWTVTNGAISMEIPVKECSVCGRPYLYIITDRFCPNCGADMRSQDSLSTLNKQDKEE